MASHKSFSRFSRAVVILATFLLLLTIAQVRDQVHDPVLAAQQRPTPPKTLRLYVFDCGSLAIPDPSSFGFTRGDLASPDMSVVCYLIAHPKGTLMWDVGALPDSVLSSGSPVTQGNATVSKSLKAQLAGVGYTPADINYLALSHYHWDHTANANDFASATWIVQKPDRDIMFSDPPPALPSIHRDTYSALANSKTMILSGEDHDVFGDGTVVLKFAPGHTPGHQVLFLELPKTGPVVLSGDLYHYPEERALHHVPQHDFNLDQTVTSRDAIEAFLKSSGAQLWIEHDSLGNSKLKKAPNYYE